MPSRNAYLISESPHRRGRPGATGVSWWAPPPPAPADVERWARFLDELPERIAEVRRIEGNDGDWPLLFPAPDDDYREAVPPAARPAPRPRGRCPACGAETYATGEAVRRAPFCRTVCGACGARRPHQEERKTA